MALKFQRYLILKGPSQEEDILLPFYYFSDRIPLKDHDILGVYITCQLELVLNLNKLGYSVIYIEDCQLLYSKYYVPCTHHVHFIQEFLFFEAV